MRKLILVAVVFALLGLCAVHAAQGSSGNSAIVGVVFKVLDVKRSFSLFQGPIRRGPDVCMKISLSRITAQLVSVDCDSTTPAEIKKYIQANAKEIDLTVVHSPGGALTPVVNDGISAINENDILMQYKRDKSKSYKGRIKVTFDQRGIRATELVDMVSAASHSTGDGVVHSNGGLAEPYDP